MKILVIVFSLLFLSFGEIKSQEAYTYYELTQLLISPKDSLGLSLVILPQDMNNHSYLFSPISLDKKQSIFSFSANFSQLFFRFQLNKIARQLVGDFLGNLIPDESDSYFFSNPQILSIPIVSVRIPIQFQ